MSLCNVGSSSKTHLFAEYLYYRVAWRQSQWRLRDTQISRQNVAQIVGLLVLPSYDFTENILELKDFQTFRSILPYQLWESKNKRRYTNQVLDIK